MPFSEVLPAVVLPDTDEGRQDAEPYEKELLYVGFCQDYEPDDQIGRNAMRGQCLHRFPFGDRKHNWCFACLAGYVSWDFEDDPFSDSLVAERLLASR